MKLLKWGQKVFKTEEAKRNGIAKGHKYGIFLGYDRTGNYYRIVPDGLSTPSTYAKVFWRN